MTTDPKTAEREQAIFENYFSVGKPEPSPVPAGAGDPPARRPEPQATSIRNLLSESRPASLPPSPYGLPRARAVPVPPRRVSLARQFAVPVQIKGPLPGRGEDYRGRRADPDAFADLVARRDKRKKRKPQ